MSRGDVLIDLGEKSPVFGTLAVASGTETDVSATFTLYDDTGEIVTDFDAIAVTGQSGSGTTAIVVWYLLDTAGLSDGYYTALFWVTITTSDGMTRRKPVLCDVYVRAVP